jgi:hypothetical protein
MVRSIMQGGDRRYSVFVNSVALLPTVRVPLSERRGAATRQIKSFQPLQRRGTFVLHVAPGANRPNAAHSAVRQATHK